MLFKTAELKREADWVKRFIEKKTTIPVLANIAMHAGAHGLTLIGTNLEIAGIATLQNIRDMVAKGRWRSGTKTCPEAYYQKLDPARAELARILYSIEWYSLAEIGHALGVSRNMIHAIVKNRCWIGPETALRGETL